MPFGRAGGGWFLIVFANALKKNSKTMLRSPFNLESKHFRTVSIACLPDQSDTWATMCNAQRAVSVDCDPNGASVTVGPVDGRQIRQGEKEAVALWSYFAQPDTSLGGLMG